MPGRRRLIFLPIITMLPLLVFETVTQINLRDARVWEVRQEAMRLLDLVESEQQRLVEDIRHILGTISILGGNELLGSGCQSALDHLKTLLPDHLAVEVSDRQGRVRCATDPRSVGTRIGDRPNGDRVLAARDFVMGGYSITHGAKRPVLTFGLPYGDENGQPAGVLTALLGVEWLVDFLARKPMPKDAAIGLVDQNGTILARVPEVPELVGQPLPAAQRFMLEGEERATSETVGIDGHPRLVAYSPVKAGLADLMLWVGLSTEQALRPIERAMWRTLATFTALLAAAGFGGAWGVARFTRLRDQATRSASKMAEVLASTTDAVLEFDRDWRVTFMNARATDFLKGRSDLVGKNLWDTCPELLDTDLWRQCHEAMATGTAREFEYPGVLSRRWYVIRVFPTREGLALFVQDVTARKAAEEERESLSRELEKERTLLKGVVAHLPLGVFAVAGPEGRLLLHNATAERLVGHPVCRARDIRDFARHGAVHEDGTPYRPEDYPLARALRDGETTSQEEMHYRRGDGTRTMFAVSAAPVRDPEGRVVMAVSAFYDISERKRMEEDLRRSEERLNFALSSANAGMWDWEIESGTLTWSEGVYAIHGRSPDHITLTYDTWLAMIHPDDRENVRQSVGAALRSPSSDYLMEHRILHPEKGERWVMAMGRFVRDHGGAPLRLTGLSIDITARKRAEEALRRSEETLTLALAAAQAGTFDWDLRSDTVIWSKETFRLFGLDPERDTAGSDSWGKIVHPGDRERVLSGVNSALAEGRTDLQAEYRVLAPDGREHWMMAKGRVSYGEDGRPVRVIGLDIDTTERKLLEESLRDARDAANRANLAKSRFLAAASHDLRQPMQSMFLFAAALHGHIQNERGRNALGMLERNLETLKGLLDSLLDVSRLDAEVIRPTIEDFLIAPVLDHIGASFAPLARDKGLDFRVDCGKPLAVRSDRNLLGRMIRNLVENAIKYTEQGSVLLECRIEDGHARVSVQDTGIGIPPDQQDLIFMEFHQLGNPARDRSRGLGLGLSIVQRLSQLLEHRVTLRSEPGHGSEFALDIPLGDAAAAHAPEPADTMERNGHRRLVAVVDDDPDVLSGLQSIFGDWGFETVAGSSADQVQDRLPADGRPPVLIVADYRLGGGRTGIEAVHSLRERIGSAVPAVLLTGETQTDWKDEATAQGIDVVIKPVSPHRLHDVLRRLLGEVA